jgi:hypothetical protein
MVAGCWWDSWRQASANSESAAEEYPDRDLFQSFDQGPHIAAVPLAKLFVDRMPTRLDPKDPGSAVLLDIDLQVTANCIPSQTGP